MKRFVEAMSNRLENWVKVQTGHPSAVRFIPDQLAVAFNLYLQSPKCTASLQGTEHTLANVDSPCEDIEQTANKIEMISCIDEGLESVLIVTIVIEECEHVKPNAFTYLIAELEQSTLTIPDSGDSKH